MNDKAQALEVLVFGRAGFVGSFVFTNPKVSIGRARDAMVKLDDPAVSLKHAVLTLDGGLFRIKDLGSRTGTKVNGAPLLPRQPLEPTDEILIGPFRLRVTTCEPESEEAGPPSETTRRRASLGAAGISAPTMQPFFPEELETATSVDPYGGQPRPKEPVAARYAREDPVPEPYTGFKEPASLGETNETTVVMPAKAVATRPPKNVAKATTPAPERVARSDRPPRNSDRPGRASERPARPSERPARGFGGLDSYPAQASSQYANGETVPALEAKNVHAHFDTAQDIPLAFALPEPREPDHDEDEDDDTNFVPPFDLLEVLARAGVDDESGRAGHPLSLEVVQYRGDRVLSVRHPRLKGPLRRLGTAENIGTLEDDASFCVYPEEFRSFVVREGGRTLSTADALARREGTRMRVTAGMQVILDLPGEDKVLIHWVPRAQDVAVPPFTMKPSRNSMTEGALSVAIHLITMAFIGLVIIGDKTQSESDLNAGRFATISQKELELEPPPPPPPPEKPVVDDAPPTVDNTPVQHDPHAEKVKGPVTKGPHVAGQQSASNAASTASTNKILSALGGAPSAAGAISVTNLDALPAGAGDFKVSGSVGKAPGDSLRVSAGGSGKEVETKTASELGGNELGKVTAKTGGGAVRARVTSSAPASRGEGHLDRGEIQKVVNAHLYQIQGCYERQLAKDPSLSGKVSFDWDVGVTGGVSNVRVGRSSVHSVEVTTCIQSAIQGWRFPAPQGGSVTVTYPFAFSALGG